MLVYVAWASSESGKFSKTVDCGCLHCYHGFLDLEPAKTRHSHALSRGESPTREPNKRISS